MLNFSSSWPQLPTLTEEQPNSALLPAPAHTSGSSGLPARWYLPRPRSCCRPSAWPDPALTVADALDVVGSAFAMYAATMCGPNGGSGGGAWLCESQPMTTWLELRT